MVGYYYAIASGVSAGVTVAVGKMVSSSVSSLAYVFFLSLFSVVISYLWINFRKEILQIIPKYLMLPFYGHVVCSFLAIWTFWEGTRLMNAGVASFSVRIELVFILILSRIFFKERLTRFDLFGAVCILFGASIMGVRFDELSNSNFLEVATLSRGGILMLVSGASFAGAEAYANILAKGQSEKVENGISTSSLVFWRSLALSGLYALVIPFQGVYNAPSSSDFLVIALAALLGPFLARVFFMEALPRIGLGRSSLFAQLEPVVTSIVAWFLLGEVGTKSDWVGALFILGGCVAIQGNSISNKKRLESV